ncbi:MAG TPA: methylenetetrahydrofolate reductase C-terminal domain-containing protein [Thermodesulfobacteriota bacterium]|jgi:methylenetetrahydrofolate reductase (NADPH)|nr:methylenetetrahydrofolate reductase C-terminal domain-containing protein [Thermodesulfobacteriota bacterium]
MGKNRFKEAVLEKKEFIYTLELVPGRGSRGKTQDDILRMAEQAAKTRLVHAVSVTDNPGGHPALSPDVIGLEISRLGLDPIIHFTCKDKNRNQIESILFSLDRISISNLLVMTGDFPLYGFEGKAKPVFDLDSIQLLHLIHQMNQGLEIDGKAPGGGVRLPPTHFFKGATISPFKKYESEVMAQYDKLLKKARGGVDFLITQVGFDARKFDELLRFMRHYGIRVPIFGNVYILSAAVAGVMNRGGVPGCVITDELYRICQEESKAPDKGKRARLTRAAKLIGVLKGMGCDGVHIGGPSLRYEEVEWVIEKSKKFTSNWEEWVREFSFPQRNGFYLFEKDPKTGLNRDALIRKRGSRRKAFAYGIMRFFHHLAFTPQAPLYRPARWLCKKIDGTRMEGPITELEYWIKFITSRCRRCGDCTLLEVAFLCPQSQCPKYLFNGQCGGSFEGWCEVFPGKKKCIYVRAYNRLKPYGEEESLKEGYTPPRDWALDQTSSWANYFLGRDHHSRTIE